MSDIDAIDPFSLPTRASKLKAVFGPIIERAIVAADTTGGVYVLDYCGEAIAFGIDGAGRDEAGFESSPDGPGLWLWEGRGHSSMDYWGEWDFELCGQYRRLTPEELEAYERDGTTPFDDEEAARKLWVWIDYATDGGAIVRADGDNITVRLGGSHVKFAISGGLPPESILGVIDDALRKSSDGQPRQVRR